MRLREWTSCRRISKASVGNRYRVTKFLSQILVADVLDMIEGYFDESGDLEIGPGVFCVAGYFISAEAAKHMDEDWGAVLEKYRVPYFHMVECAPVSSDLLPTISAEQFSVANLNGRKILRIKMAEAASIGLDLDGETLRKLKDILATI